MNDEFVIHIDNTDEWIVNAYNTFRTQNIEIGLEFHTVCIPMLYAIL